MKNRFNLVEVIIAMGIIVVCITTIMGLFSTGMKISKDANMHAYSNIIMEQMIGLYDTDTVNITTPASEPTTEGTDDTNTINGADSTISIYGTSIAGVYKIKFKSLLSTNAKVVDFTLMAKMWTESTANQVYMSDGINVDYSERLFLEITWPPQEPYDNRVLQGNQIKFQKEL